MKTLTVQIPDKEFLNLGLQSNSLEFKELVKKIKLKIAKEALEKCHQLAKHEGFDSLSLDEINAEIQEIRNAKNNN